jgi:hypothetical protein
MQYTVTINEKSKTVIVNLNGYEGVAKCCETDTFNLQTGIELALERARVAEANAKKPKPTTKSMGVMELIKALEKALPKGEVVLVGNGDGLTANQKKWLASLAGEANKCNCSCHKDCDDCERVFTEEEYNQAYDEGYDEGYADGHSDGYDEGCSQNETDIDEVIEAVRNALRQ